MSNERRTHARYALWFPVTVDTSSRQLWAVCQDASAGGIRISGTGALVIGELVMVTFRIAPNQPERQIQGRIVREEERESNPRVVWEHRMAIEFLEPVPELEAVLRHVSTMPPALHH